jgi:hypothetical protein
MTEQPELYNMPELGRCDLSRWPVHTGLGLPVCAISTDQPRGHASAILTFPLRARGFVRMFLRLRGPEW